MGGAVILQRECVSCRWLDSIGLCGLEGSKCVRFSNKTIGLRFTIDQVSLCIRFRYNNVVSTKEYHETVGIAWETSSKTRYHIKMLLSGV